MMEKTKIMIKRLSSAMAGLGISDRMNWNGIC